jgi:CheY-like chemotaxis protein
LAANRHKLSQIFAYLFYHSPRYLIAWTGQTVKLFEGGFVRILAVDNDPIVLETLVQLLLQHPGYDVIAALTPDAAREALGQAKKNPFDCILIDGDFAAMGSVALLEDIRGRDGYAQTPILILTAVTDKPHIDAAFAAGTTDYMTKPFAVSTLLGRLATMTAPAARPAPAPAPALDAPVCLSAKLKIYDTDRFIALTALENYAKQLSRSALYGSCVFGFAVRDIEMYHSALSPFDFHCMINDVADAISHEMQSCQSLLSYAGDGIFVGIVERDWRPQTERVMNHVNARLAQTDITDGDGHVLDVRVSAGHALRLTWKSGSSVLEALTQARNSAATARIAHGKLRDGFWFMDRIA